LEGKFVVMYSGNHSPCHPLDTLLGAALELCAHPRIAFCFVGGGSEFNRVVNWVREHSLHNIVYLPYRPFAELSSSLSAADLHAVVMGNAFVGLVHPCKVYNIRQIGAPFIYIGPAKSPIAELNPAASFLHGEVDAVAKFIASASDLGLPPVNNDPGE